MTPGQHVSEFVSYFRANSDFSGDCLARAKNQLRSAVTSLTDDQQGYAPPSMRLRQVNAANELFEMTLIMEWVELELRPHLYAHFGDDAPWDADEWQLIQFKASVKECLPVTTGVGKEVLERLLLSIDESYRNCKFPF